MQSFHTLWVVSRLIAAVQHCSRLRLQCARKRSLSSVRWCEYDEGWFSAEVQACVLSKGVCVIIVSGRVQRSNLPGPSLCGLENVCWQRL